MAAPAIATPIVPTSSPKKTIKSPKSKKTTMKMAKTPTSHPTYQAMIKSAIIGLKETKGSSRAAILKYILQHYKVGNNIILVNAHLRTALKRGAKSGLLRQTKGVGATGSFRLAETKKQMSKKMNKKPKIVKPVKKVAKTMKTTKTTKKVTGSVKPKKTITKKTTKSPKKTKTTKSPKKVKTPKKKMTKKTKQVTASPK